MSALCPGSSPWDITSACSRALWSAGVPATIAFILIIRALLQTVISKRAISFPFAPFLTLQEAEEILYPNDTSPDAHAAPVNTHSPSSIALSIISCAQAVSWVVVSAFFTPASAWWAPALVGLTWVYSAARLILRPKPTPQYGLFVLWNAHLAFSLVDNGAIFFSHAADGTPLPTHDALFARTANVAALVSVLALTVSRPLALPSAHVDREKIGASVSPEDYTTLWSWITFSWVYPIIAKGTNSTLNEDDVWDMSSTLRAKPSFVKFQTIMRRTLFRRLMVAHACDALIHLSLVCVSVALQYSQPMLLNRLLAAINGTATPAARASAIVFALLMFAAAATKTECDLQYLWRSRRMSANIRCELMAAIYDKALRRKVLASTSGGKPKGGADIGRIVNLFSNDAIRLSEFANGVFILMSAPVEIVVACVLLYQVLGWSAFAGFAIFPIVLPIHWALTKWGVRIQRGQLNASDKRMSVINELISEVRFIKFFAWGEKWIERALEARRVELSWVVKDRINSSLFGLLWMIVPSFVSVTSFSVYIWTGHKLTIPVAFTSIALFSMLESPMDTIPHFISSFLRIGVSAQRIESFLEEEDVTEAGSSRENLNRPTSAPDNETIAIENASFVWNVSAPKKTEDKPKSSWFGWVRRLRLKFWKRPATVVEPGPKKQEDEDEDAEKPFELRDIHVSFPPRQLTLVTGATASGKSALLHALLGEMTQSSAGGRVVLPAGRISYAAQSPWLQHRTIRDNILFGEPLDEERYDAVLEACTLKPDLAMFDDGDRTEIGVRGVSLSGGQKARVALARAVYQHTDLVLLDDPLSAVDSHTARQLLDKLFRGPLLANRTVILVTHHVELMLPAAQFVVRIVDGRIDSAGTPRELRAQGVLEAIKHDAGNEIEEPPSEKAEADGEKQEEKKEKPKQLVEPEKRAEGRVKWQIYNTYLRASSYWTWIAVLAFIVLFEIFKVSQLLWIKVWGEASLDTSPPSTVLSHSSSFVVQNEPSGSGAVHELPVHGMGATTWPKLPSADEHPMFYVAVYAAITLGTATMSLINNVIEYIGAYRASRVLFEKLLVTVVHATFRWFDVTPTGRILNRFSRDVAVVDSSLASSIQTFMGTFTSFLAGIITISYVLPGFLLPAIAIAYIYYRLAIGYLNTGRDLRRMEAVTRSPVFQSFSELLEGIVTVRAFCAEQRFLDGLFGMLDLTNKMWWTFWMLNRYLLFRFDIIGASTVLAVALLGLSTITSSGGIAGWTGVTITTAMNLTRSIYWTCRFITQLELDLNSVERVIEYLDLPQEPPAVIESHRPPAYWPSSSGGPERPLLSVKELSIKYAPDLPAVLHKISFDLRARERVGLLGRTGSGKSTIAMSLLRFVEPAGGSIVIDGIDISTIGLQDLRSKITFIPQDAALFSGTIRDNLDPFNEFSDEECADVLARVHLASSAGSAFTSSSKAPPPPAEGGSAGEAKASTPSASSVGQVEDTRQSVSLDTKVSAGGKNFSQGQRQLVSLARAMLRRSAIIVMDEATSSIDFETDAKIQATIREEFKDSLLLTVAHRLKTVADYDRLVVLDKGNIVEFDTPLNLIHKQGGYFRNMALKSGSFSELEAIAVAAAAASKDE